VVRDFRRGCSQDADQASVRAARWATARDRVGVREQGWQADLPRAAEPAGGRAWATVLPAHLLPARVQVQQAGVPVWAQQETALRAWLPRLPRYLAAVPAWDRPSRPGWPQVSAGLPWRSPANDGPPALRWLMRRT